MSRLPDPPIQDAVIETEGDPAVFGKARLSWVNWFQELIFGDRGNSWAPTAVSLTVVGTPTITGNYYKNQGFTDFWIKIVPGTNTTSTAGTTYFELPFDVLVDAPNFAVQNGFAAGSIGIIDASTNRCYPAGWAGVTGIITVSGRVLTP